MIPPQLRQRLFSFIMAGLFLMSLGAPVVSAYYESSAYKQEDWISGDARGQVFLYDRTGVKTSYNVSQLDSVGHNDKRAWYQPMKIMQEANNCGQLDDNPYNPNEACPGKRASIAASEGRVTATTANVNTNPLAGGVNPPLIGCTPAHDSSQPTLADFQPVLFTVATIALASWQPELAPALKATSIGVALYRSYSPYIGPTVDYQWKIHFDHTTGFLNDKTVESNHVLQLATYTYTLDPGDQYSGTNAAGFTYQSVVHTDSGVYNREIIDILTFARPPIPPGNSVDTNSPTYAFKVSSSTKEWEDLMEVWK